MAKSKENSKRINFSSIKRVIDYPDFLDVQLKSYHDFLQLDTPAEKREQEGLYKVFSENFPISDSRDNYLLEFTDYLVDPPKYSVTECIDRGLTFSVPLKAKLQDARRGAKRCGIRAPGERCCPGGDSVAAPRSGLESTAQKDIPSISKSNFRK